MRIRTIATTAVLLTAGLTLTACGGGDSKSDSAPPTAATVSSTPVATTPVAIATTSKAPATTTPAKPAPTPTPTKPHPTKSPKGCGVNRDVDVWYRVPGISDSAQVLGSYAAVGCQSTFQMIKATSPTGAGYCTEAAWASDNPGYNADADPAKRLKKVQVSVGAGC